MHHHMRSRPVELRSPLSRLGPAHREEGPVGDDDVLQVEQVGVLRRRHDPPAHVDQHVIRIGVAAGEDGQDPASAQHPGGDHAQPPVHPGAAGAGVCVGVGEIGEHDID